MYSAEDVRCREIEDLQRRLNEARDERDAWGVGNSEHASLWTDEIIRCRQGIYSRGGIVKDRLDRTVG